MPVMCLLIPDEDVRQKKILDKLKDADYCLPKPDFQQFF